MQFINKLWVINECLFIFLKQDMQFYSWIFVYAFYLNSPFLTCLPYALTYMATHVH